MPERTDEIAIEHVLWAAKQGMLPGDVLASIGVEWPNASVTTETVITALTMRWLQLKGV